MGRASWSALAAAVLVGAVLVAGPGAAGATTTPFAASVSRVSAEQLRFSYRPGCPVGPAELRRVRLTYRGFDGRAHHGSLIVNKAVVDSVKRIFARLYSAGFPIHRLTPIDAYGGSDDRSIAADNTSAFNCRYAVAAGPKRWSAHAYGEAIDVNPVENPYLEGGKVLPPAGRAYLERSVVRPGMAIGGGRLVAAFTAEGWLWGGRWTGSPDLQHFSTTGG